MAKTCPECGSQCEEDARFCGECGSEISGQSSAVASEANCPNCNATIASDDRFCGECGAEVDGPSPKQENESQESAAPLKPAGSTSNSASQSNKPYVYGAAALLAAAIVGFVVASGVNSPPTGTPKAANQPVEPRPSNRTAVRQPKTPAPLPQPSSRQTAIQPKKPPPAPVSPIIKTTGLEGVVGNLEDQSARAQICRKNGRCLPGDGTDIKTGDAIKAPKLVVLYIEDPKGFSKHGLTGSATNIRIVSLPGGQRALDLTLSEGTMQGTIRDTYHVIRAGDGFCIVRGSDYAAEAKGRRGAFKIERGSANCYANGRKVKLDASNPIFRW